MGALLGGGFRVGHPAEDEGLHEGSSVELAAAPHEAALRGDLVGNVGKDVAHVVGDSWYRGGHGALLCSRHGMSNTPSLPRRGSSCQELKLLRMRVLAFTRKVPLARRSFRSDLRSRVFPRGLLAALSRWDLDRDMQLL